MAKLICSTIASLDGYVEDASGRFDWAAPDEEVHASVNDPERPIGTCLYGRRMYRRWSSGRRPVSPTTTPEVIRDFGSLWRSADKIVFSKALISVTTARARIERDFDPGSIRRLKQSGDAYPSLATRCWPDRRSPLDSSTRSSCSSSR